MNILKCLNNHTIGNGLMTILVDKQLEDAHSMHMVHSKIKDVTE